MHAPLNNAGHRRWDLTTHVGRGHRTVLNQISQLMADKHRLVKRTQLKRSSAKVIGAALYPKKKVRRVAS
jgi:hypothetical protein